MSSLIDEMKKLGKIVYMVSICIPAGNLFIMKLMYSMNISDKTVGMNISLLGAVVIGESLSGAVVISVSLSGAVEIVVM